MQAFIQGVLNGARDFEQQPSCKAKRWCVSADAYQWERMFADAYQWERMFADAYQWACVSADVYQWERCLFFLTAFCGGCNSAFSFTLFGRFCVMHLDCCLCR